MQIISKDSCNIYYVENGICRAGILDHADKYSQGIGTSSTLVPVKIVDSTAVGTPGEKVKPSNIFFYFCQIVTFLKDQ
jgi:hypothetical protein